MSISIMDRVWRHSKARKGELLFDWSGSQQRSRAQDQ